MCGKIFGVIWIIGGIFGVIMGLLGKSVDIGFKKKFMVRGIEAVILGFIFIAVGIALIFFM